MRALALLDAALKYRLNAASADAVHNRSLIVAMGNLLLFTVYGLCSMIIDDCVNK